MRKLILAALVALAPSCALASAPVYGLLQAQNALGELAPVAAQARMNLGLGSAATMSASAFDAAGSASTAQAASLQKSSNLSDVSNAATARTNLGLGTAATSNTSAFDAAGTAASTLSAAIGTTVAPLPLPATDLPAATSSVQGALSLTTAGAQAPVQSVGTGLTLTGTQASANIGISAGTVAAGNDSRITGALQTSAAGPLATQAGANANAAAVAALGYTPYNATNPSSYVNAAAALAAAPVQSVAGLTGAPSAAQTRAALAATTTLTAGPSYTALTTDTRICVAETTPVATTITLPASPLANQVIDVNDCGGHASTATITIAAASIMGTTSVLMNQPYEDLTLKYTSGGWAIW